VPAEIEAPFSSLAGLPLSLAASAWMRGQQARAEESNPEQASKLLENARESALLRPFARCALACLGRDDFAAVLAETPGSLLTPRFRLWQSLVRFCRREEATELLQAIQQAHAAGYRTTTLAGWQRLAHGLASATPKPP